MKFAYFTFAKQIFHIEQPHMATLRSFKDDYIAKTTLGEFKTL
jgi:hypothetical protein